MTSSISASSYFHGRQGRPSPATTDSLSRGRKAESGFEGEETPAWQTYKKTYLTWISDWTNQILDKDPWSKDLKVYTCCSFCSKSWKCLLTMIQWDKTTKKTTKNNKTNRPAVQAADLSMVSWRSKNCRLDNSSKLKPWKQIGKVVA